MAVEKKVALVGIGGYGEMYATELFRSSAQHAVRLVAGIDPFAEVSTVFSEFQKRNIPIYENLEKFYEDHFADLVIVSAPIQHHAPYTTKALHEGSNVLCEKPVSGTIQEGLSMRNAEIETGRFIAIGYQWSFSPAILELKRDIRKGLLGQPRSMKTMVLWPRSDRYYQRNSWAGRLKVNNQWVLDSPVNNATSHYLHNIFFILGTAENLISVQAELYRAREIENYDTAALRCMTKSGVEVLFYTTHSTQESIGPVLEYTFSKATVTFDADLEQGLVAHFKNGKMKNYGRPDREDDHWRKLWESVDAVRGGKLVSCGVVDSLAQTICMNGAQESVKDVITFQDRLVKRFSQDIENFYCVDGLKDIIVRSFQQGVLPEELGDVPWAKMGSVVTLIDYKYFPSRER